MFSVGQTENVGFYSFQGRFPLPVSSRSLSLSIIVPFQMYSYDHEFSRYTCNEIQFSVHTFHSFGAE